MQIKKQKVFFLLVFQSNSLLLQCKIVYIFPERQDFAEMVEGSNVEIGYLGAFFIVYKRHNRLQTCIIRHRVSVIIEFLVGYVLHSCRGHGRNKLCRDLGSSRAVLIREQVGVKICYNAY